MLTISVGVSKTNMQVIREEHFVCTDIDRNNNKVWSIQEYDNCSVTTKWGRVGDSLQSKTWSFDSQSEASHHYEKKKREKLRVKSNRDSYTKVEVLDHTTSAPASNLSVVAERDIESDSETTKQLIRWLSEVNRHQITTQTTITYDFDDAVFKTPLGVVSPSMVKRARELLGEIAPLVQNKAFDDTNLKRYANEYLRLIPRNLGRARSKLRLDHIFADDSKISAEHDILDSLEASTVAKPKIKGKSSRVFDAKLYEVADKKIIREVETLYNKTKQSIHVSHVYKVARVFSLEIATMKKAWEKDGAKMTNIWRLWHGTSYANLLSIMYSGLKVPTRFTNGWNYGKGLYFSDQSTKSLNYAAGYWDNTFGKHQKCFMFLADVAMGNYWIAPRSGDSRPKEYDATFAKAGESGILNNEMIVPRASQANLVYLVEFVR